MYDFIVNDAKFCCQNNYFTKNNKSSFIFNDIFTTIEGADRVRGRGRRGGGRGEKRGREEGEGRKKGREGERGKFCARKARAAPEGRRETGGGGGKGARGGEAYPPCPPPHYCKTLYHIWLKAAYNERFIPSCTHRSGASDFLTRISRM